MRPGYPIKGKPEKFTKQNPKSSKIKNITDINKKRTKFGIKIKLNKTMMDGIEK
jgi:hypothetical protein